MLWSPKLGSCPGKPPKVHEIVLVDRNVKLREIAEKLNISEGSVCTIFAASFVDEKGVDERV